jgi:DNA-binding transcriptional regulator YiaG
MGQFYKEELARFIRQHKAFREYIAFKLNVSTRTIDRWRRGETSPRPAEVEKIQKIIKGYFSKKGRGRNK